MSTKEAVEVIRAAFPECSVVRGWHLDGAGPARFGYAVVHPAGRVRFLGRCAPAIVQDLLREIDERRSEKLA